MVEERTAAGLILSTHVYGRGPILQRRAGATAYYLLDGHSGVRLLTDAAAAVTDAYAHAAFGTLLGSLGHFGPPKTGGYEFGEADI